MTDTSREERLALIRKLVEEAEEAGGGQIESEDAQFLFNEVARLEAENDALIALLAKARYALQEVPDVLAALGSVVVDLEAALAATQENDDG